MQKKNIPITVHAFAINWNNKLITSVKRTQLFVIDEIL